MPHIYHIPSWWPSQKNEFSGIFIYELIRNIAIQDAAFCHTVGVFNTTFRWISLTHLIRDIKGLAVIDTALGFDQDLNIDVFEMPRVIGVNPKTGINYIEKLVYRYLCHIKSLPHKPDLIHVHVSFPSVVLGYELSKQLGIPYILTEHSSRFPDDRFFQYGYHQQYLKAAYLHSRSNISVSKLLADKFNYYGAVTSDVIYNAIRWDRPVLRPVVGKSKPLFSFVWIGVMNTMRKRVDILLNAILNLIRIRSDFNCILIGEGSYLPSYKNLATQLKIDSCITWIEHGSSDVVQKTLMQSDCLVISSDYETFGITAIEALSYGLPVLSTACDGVEEIINDSCGRIVNKSDAPALAHGMSWMMDNFRLFDPLDIQNYCYSNFERASIARKYLNLYRKVLNT
jgi:glycosyltransferase involved in cell wall biosynthesis